jgi:hypothetical protein
MQDATAMKPTRFVGLITGVHLKLVDESNFMEYAYGSELASPG